MNRKQRRSATKLGKQASPLASGTTLSPSAAITELLGKALRHHRAGELVEAEVYYQKILLIEQRHFDSLHLLGVIAHQSGRSELAVHLIGRAIALNDPEQPHGKVKSESSAPGRGKHRVTPHDLAVGYSNLSIVLMALGNPTEALKAIQRSLQLEATENTKLLFVQCVQVMKSIPEGIDLRDNLARALSEPWGRPAELARLAAILIQADAVAGPCIRGFADARTDGRQKIIGPAELCQVSRDRLLCCLMEASIVFDVVLEQYLTAVRRSLLEMVSAGVGSVQFWGEVLRFCCALAQQCFINEYIFPCADQESSQSEHLRKWLTEALASGRPIPEPSIVIFATYFPLVSLPEAHLLAQRHWSAPVAQLVESQVKEVEQERKLRSSIPALTAIDDSWSIAVRQQYEESPYPRWAKASPVGNPTTIAAYLRSKFPNLDLDNLPTSDGLEILIAGCGTGQHSIETARQFKGSRVLAVDLSLASLCYAKRKTQELGLKNIDYGQADILQLQSIGRTFDVIEASGVLHHLADPMAGWRILLSLLRPAGLMRLALYSRLARQELSAAREFIAQRGYGSTPAEIRRFRQEIMGSGPDTGLAKKLAYWGDFFSTSSCRDLLFHVQEHLLTLPEIGSFMEQNQLEFLGFVLPESVLQKFRRRFPEEKGIRDLALWNLFERENSLTFAGMYEFWAQKVAL